MFESKAGAFSSGALSMFLASVPGAWGLSYKIDTVIIYAFL
jgi:hypothetical protein